MVTVAGPASDAQVERDGSAARCPCGDASARPLILRNGVGLLRCRACGLFRRPARPDPAAVLRYYRDEYWTAYAREQTSDARSNVYRHALDRLEAFAPLRGLLVDVGCGMGALLAPSRERGWRPIGIEPSPLAVSLARARGLEAIESAWPAALPPEFADAVTFVNVLDHMTDPVAALREAWRVLKPGGLLYIRVPNAPLHVWAMTTLPAAVARSLAIIHLFGFGRAAFRRLLPRLGFAVRLIRAAPPSQADAYGETAGAGGEGRRWLRHLAALGHRLATWTGLDRLGCGAALEVVAAKPHRNGEGGP